jgi:hypothetical protein
MPIVVLLPVMSPSDLPNEVWATTLIAHHPTRMKRQTGEPR